MKFLITTVLLLLYFMSADARLVNYAPSAESLKSMGLKGKILKIEESHFRVKYNKNNTSAYHNALDSAAAISYYYEKTGTNTYNFNKYGLLTEKVLFDTVNNEPLTTRYTYRNGAIESMANYKDGRLKDSLYFKSSRAAVRYSMAYDNKRRYTGRVMYTYSKDKLKTIRRKDKGNAIIEMISYDYYNGRLTEIGYYDEHLKLVKRSDINIEDRGEGKLYTSELKYNQDNRFLGMESFLQDAAGNRIEETVADSNRRVTSYTMNKYNERNELTEQTTFADRKYQYRFDYTYDKAGNQIKKQVYRNDTLVYVIEWKYEYED